ncbi:efflux RND transporter periplasmic adaptor subunit [Pseudomonas xanthosomatis]|uniref:Efflux RND transporter periplasmic adaptor subunit n=1 Tax=Pseudomonas fakonensis TaxID=2842355 RepID=A0ABX8NBZ2_9PSED|nr:MULTISPECIES: efflux RND transporter periplasmic adaptor subunit [Pseudomonas]QXH48785.1 efflux RND transporter periplasmic adaptor subunit [Pseudomonas xanthosomatis]QXH53519.1 efflux RND transporter periplasmic adaptor subunit [Pseudomonas fakonensis]
MAARQRKWAAVLAILVAVAAERAQAEGDNGELRVQLSPIRQTVLSSEIGGKLVELDVKEGDTFKQGQRLAAFDCSVQKAQLSRSQAALAGAQKKLEVARKLDALESISQSEVTQARADMAIAQAESGVGRAMLGRCTLNAPFAGRVSQRMVQRWQHVAEGTELLAIYDDSVYQLELIVPSSWLGWLKPGQAFAVQLDETGQRYSAQVERLGAAIDPVSQSLKVFARITGDTSALLPGMSGVALLAPPGAGS